MSLEGAQFICLDEAGNRGKIILPKGRKFTVGNYASCDFVLTDDDNRCEGIHCTIECDAFGRISIRNMSDEHPILLNGCVFENKRNLFNNSTITILDKQYLWLSSSNSDVAEKELGQHKEEFTTPKKQIGLPEHSGFSSPGLKTKKGESRFTVHNFAYCIQSDEDGNTSIDTNREISSLDNAAEENPENVLENSPTRRPVSECELSTPGPQENIKSSTYNEIADAVALEEGTPKTNLINSTNNKENTGSTSIKNRLQLSKCHQSEIVITSFSPRETGVKTEKSFTAILLPKVLVTKAANTPKSVYSTPKSILGDDDENADDDDGGFDKSHDYNFHTPSTSKKTGGCLKNSSMHLVDFTTPRKLAPASPYLKSALKASTKKMNKATKNITAVSENQLGVSVLPCTPTAGDENKGSIVTPGSVHSVISVDSTDTSSIIEILSDASTPGLSSAKTPQKCDNKKTQPTTTPTRTPQSLMKRTIIGNINRQVTTPQRATENTQQTTPRREPINRIPLRTSIGQLRSPATPKTPQVTAEVHIAQRRTSVSTPSRKNISASLRFEEGTFCSSTNNTKFASPSAVRRNLMPKSATKELMTSTPLRGSGSTSRLSSGCNTTPLHRVRKSLGGVTLSSHISKARKSIIAAAPPNFTSIKEKSPQQKMSDKILYRARKSSFGPISPMIARAINIVQTAKEKPSPTTTILKHHKLQRKTIGAETFLSSENKVTDRSRTFILGMEEGKNNDEKESENTASKECEINNLTFSPRRKESDETKDNSCKEQKEKIVNLTFSPKKDNEIEVKEEEEIPLDVNEVPECIETANTIQPAVKSSSFVISRDNTEAKDAILDIPTSSSQATEDSFAEEILELQNEERRVSESKLGKAKEVPMDSKSILESGENEDGFGEENVASIEKVDISKTAEAKEVETLKSHDVLDKSTGDVYKPIYEDITLEETGIEKEIKDDESLVEKTHEEGGNEKNTTEKFINPNESIIPIDSSEKTAEKNELPESNPEKNQLPEIDTEKNVVLKKTENPEISEIPLIEDVSLAETSTILDVPEKDIANNPATTEDVSLAETSTKLDMSQQEAAETADTKEISPAKTSSKSDEPEQESLEILEIKDVSLTETSTKCDVPEEESAEIIKENVSLADTSSAIDVPEKESSEILEIKDISLTETSRKFDVPEEESAEKETSEILEIKEVSLTDTSTKFDIKDVSSTETSTKFDVPEEESADITTENVSLADTSSMIDLPEQESSEILEIKEVSLTETSTKCDVPEEESAEKETSEILEIKDVSLAETSTKFDVPEEESADITTEDVSLADTSSMIDVPEQETAEISTTEDVSLADTSSMIDVPEKETSEILEIKDDSLTETSTKVDVSKQEIVEIVSKIDVTEQEIAEIQPIEDVKEIPKISSTEEISLAETSIEIVIPNQSNEEISSKEDVTGADTSYKIVVTDQPNAKISSKEDATVADNSFEIGEPEEETTTCKLLEEIDDVLNKSDEINQKHLMDHNDDDSESIPTLTDDLNSEKLTQDTNITSSEISDIVSENDAGKSENDVEKTENNVGKSENDVVKTENNIVKFENDVVKSETESEKCDVDKESSEDSEKVMDNTEDIKSLEIHNREDPQEFEESNEAEILTSSCEPKYSDEYTSNTNSSLLQENRSCESLGNSADENQTSQVDSEIQNLEDRDDSEKNLSLESQRENQTAETTENIEILESATIDENILIDDNNKNIETENLEDNGEEEKNVSSIAKDIPKIDSDNLENNVVEKETIEASNSEESTNIVKENVEKEDVVEKDIIEPSTNDEEEESNLEKEKNEPPIPEDNNELDESNIKETQNKDISIMENIESNTDDISNVNEIGDADAKAEEVSRPQPEQIVSSTDDNKSINQSEIIEITNDDNKIKKSEIEIYNEESKDKTNEENKFSNENNKNKDEKHLLIETTDLKQCKEIIDIKSDKEFVKNSPGHKLLESLKNAQQTPKRRSRRLSCTAVHVVNVDSNSAKVDKKEEEASTSKLRIRRNSATPEVGSIQTPVKAAIEIESSSVITPRRSTRRKSISTEPTVILSTPKRATRRSSMTAETTTTTTTAAVTVTPSTKTRRSSLSAVNEIILTPKRITRRRSSMSLDTDEVLITKESKDENEKTTDSKAEEIKEDMGAIIEEEEEEEVRAMAPNKEKDNLEILIEDNLEEVIKDEEILPLSENIHPEETYTAAPKTKECDYKSIEKIKTCNNLQLNLEEVIQVEEIEKLTENENEMSQEIQISNNPKEEEIQNDEVKLLEEDVEVMGQIVDVSIPDINQEEDKIVDSENVGQEVTSNIVESIVKDLNVCPPNINTTDDTSICEELETNNDLPQHKDSSQAEYIDLNTTADEDMETLVVSDNESIYDYGKEVQGETISERRPKTPLRAKSIGIISKIEGESELKQTVDINFHSEIRKEDENNEIENIETLQIADVKEDEQIDNVAMTIQTSETPKQLVAIKDDDPTTSESVATEMRLVLGVKEFLETPQVCDKRESTKAIELLDIPEKSENVKESNEILLSAEENLTAMTSKALGNVKEITKIVKETEESEDQNIGELNEKLHSSCSSTSEEESQIVKGKLNESIPKEFAIITESPTKPKVIENVGDANKEGMENFNITDTLEEPNKIKQIGDSVESNTQITEDNSKGGEYKGVRELLKTPPKGCSTPRFGGIRELMKTPKYHHNSTPILGGLNDIMMMNTPPPKKGQQKNLDQFLKTPTAKNIMIPTLPPSAIIEKPEDSVEMVHSIVYNLNDTHEGSDGPSSSNLGELFKTPVSSRFMDRLTDSYANDDEEEEGGQEKVKDDDTKTPHNRKSLQIHPIPITESPFTTADILTDLSRTEVENWVDKMDPLAHSQLNEDGDVTADSDKENQKGKTTFDESIPTNIDDSLSVVPETCQKAALENVSCSSEALMSTTIHKTLSKDPLEKSIKEKYKESPSEAADISGIDLLDETTESVMENSMEPNEYNDDDDDETNKLQQQNKQNDNIEKEEEDANDDLSEPLMLSDDDDDNDETLISETETSISKTELATNPIIELPQSSKARVSEDLFENSDDTIEEEEEGNENATTKKKISQEDEKKNDESIINPCESENILPDNSPVVETIDSTQESTESKIEKTEVKDSSPSTETSQSVVVNLIENEIYPEQDNDTSSQEVVCILDDTSDEADVIATKENVNASSEDNRKDKESQEVISLCDDSTISSSDESKEQTVNISMSKNKNNKILGDVINIDDSSSEDAPTVSNKELIDNDNAIDCDSMPTEPLQTELVENKDNSNKLANSDIKYTFENQSNIEDNTAGTSNSNEMSTVEMEESEDFPEVKQTADMEKTSIITENKDDEPQIPLIKINESETSDDSSSSKNNELITETVNTDKTSNDSKDALEQKQEELVLEEQESKGLELSEDNTESIDTEDKSPQEKEESLEEFKTCDESETKTDSNVIESSTSSQNIELNTENNESNFIRDNETLTSSQEDTEITSSVKKDNELDEAALIVTEPSSILKTTEDKMEHETAEETSDKYSSETVTEERKLNISNVEEETGNVPDTDDALPKTSIEEAKENLTSLKATNDVVEETEQREDHENISPIRNTDIEEEKENVTVTNDEEIETETVPNEYASDVEANDTVVEEPTKHDKENVNIPSNKSTNKEKETETETETVPTTNSSPKSSVEEAHEITDVEEETKLGENNADISLTTGSECEKEIVTIPNNEATENITPLQSTDIGEEANNSLPKVEFEESSEITLPLQTPDIEMETENIASPNKAIEEAIENIHPLQTTHIEEETENVIISDAPPKTIVEETNENITPLQISEENIEKISNIETAPKTIIEDDSENIRHNETVNVEDERENLSIYTSTKTAAEEESENITPLQASNIEIETENVSNAKASTKTTDEEASENKITDIEEKTHNVSETVPLQASNIEIETENVSNAKASTKTTDEEASENKITDIEEKTHNVSNIDAMQNTELCVMEETKTRIETIDNEKKIEKDSNNDIVEDTEKNKSDKENFNIIASHSKSQSIEVTSEEMSSLKTTELETEIEKDEENYINISSKASPVISPEVESVSQIENIILSPLKSKEIMDNVKDSLLITSKDQEESENTIESTEIQSVAVENIEIAKFESENKSNVPKSSSLESNPTEDVAIDSMAKEKSPCIAEGSTEQSYVSVMPQKEHKDVTTDSNTDNTLESFNIEVKIRDTSKPSESIPSTTAGETSEAINVLQDLKPKKRARKASQSSVDSNDSDRTRKRKIKKKEPKGVNLPPVKEVDDIQRNQKESEETEDIQTLDGKSEKCENELMDSVQLDLQITDNIEKSEIGEKTSSQDSVLKDSDAMSFEKNKPSTITSGEKETSKTLKSEKKDNEVISEQSSSQAIIDEEKLSQGSSAMTAKRGARKPRRNDRKLPEEIEETENLTKKDNKEDKDDRNEILDFGIQTSKDGMENIETTAPEILNTETAQTLTETTSYDEILTVKKNDPTKRNRRKPSHTKEKSNENTVEEDSNAENKDLKETGTSLKRNRRKPSKTESKKPLEDLTEIQTVEEPKDTNESIKSLDENTLKVVDEISEDKSEDNTTKAVSEIAKEIQISNEIKSNTDKEGEIAPTVELKSKSMALSKRNRRKGSSDSNNEDSTRSRRIVRKKKTEEEKDHEIIEENDSEKIETVEKKESKTSEESTTNVTSEQQDEPLNKRTYVSNAKKDIIHEGNAEDIGGDQIKSNENVDMKSETEKESENATEPKTKPKRNRRKASHESDNEDIALKSRKGPNKNIESQESSLSTIDEVVREKSNLPSEAVSDPDDIAASVKAITPEDETAHSSNKTSRRIRRKTSKDSDNETVTTSKSKRVQHKNVESSEPLTKIDQIEKEEIPESKQIILSVVDSIIKDDEENTNVIQQEEEEHHLPNTSKRVRNLSKEETKAKYDIITESELNVIKEKKYESNEINAEISNVKDMKDKEEEEVDKKPLKKPTKRPLATTEMTSEVAGSDEPESRRAKHEDIIDIKKNPNVKIQETEIQCDKTRKAPTRRKVKAVEENKIEKEAAPPPLRSKRIRKVSSTDTETLHTSDHSEERPPYDEGGHNINVPFRKIRGRKVVQATKEHHDNENKLEESPHLMVVETPSSLSLEKQYESEEPPLLSHDEKSNADIKAEDEKQIKLVEDPVVENKTSTRSRRVRKVKESDEEHASHASHHEKASTSSRKDHFGHDNEEVLEKDRKVKDVEENSNQNSEISHRDVLEEDQQRVEEKPPKKEEIHLLEDDHDDKSSVYSNKSNKVLEEDHQKQKAKSNTRTRRGRNIHLDVVSDDSHQAEDEHKSAGSATPVIVHEEIGPTSRRRLPSRKKIDHDKDIDANISNEDNTTAETLGTLVKRNNRGKKKIQTATVDPETQKPQEVVEDHTTTIQIEEKVETASSSQVHQDEVVNSRGKKKIQTATADPETHKPQEVVEDHTSTIQTEEKVEASSSSSHVHQDEVVNSRGKKKIQTAIAEPETHKPHEVVEDHTTTIQTEEKAEASSSSSHVHQDEVVNSVTEELTPSKRGRNVPQRRAATCHQSYDETSDSEKTEKKRRKPDSPRKSMEAAKNTQLQAIASETTTAVPSPTLSSLAVTARGRTRKPNARVQQFLEEERAKNDTPKRRAADTPTKGKRTRRGAAKTTDSHNDVEETSDNTKVRDDEITSPTTSTRGRKPTRKAKLADIQHENDPEEPPLKKSPAAVETTSSEEMATPTRVAARRNAAAAATFRIKDYALDTDANEPPKKSRAKKHPAKAALPVEEKQAEQTLATSAASLEEDETVNLTSHPTKTATKRAVSRKAVTSESHTTDPLAVEASLPAKRIRKAKAATATHESDDEEHTESKSATASTTRGGRKNVHFEAADQNQNSGVTSSEETATTNKRTTRARRK